jgi:hypothetical protein
VTVGAALGTGAALHVLGRRAGSTSAERKAGRPGDDLVPAPQLVTDHAVTIGALPAEIWPWLTQMGWHRGGYYTPRWVDRLLFPGNWPSLDRLDPDLIRDLRVGSVVPDGPPGTAEYRVAEVDPPRVLVLRSTTHVPPGWDIRFGAAIVWTWSFRMDERPDGTTRVHLRVRGRMSPWWFAALYVVLIPPADYVMAVGMLRGLRRRVEGSRRTASRSGT